MLCILVIYVVFDFIDAMSRERGVVMIIMSPEYVVLCPLSQTYNDQSNSHFSCRPLI
jgi:hypothetical protein